MYHDVRSGDQSKKNYTRYLCLFLLTAIWTFSLLGCSLADNIVGPNPTDNSTLGSTNTTGVAASITSDIVRSKEPVNKSITATVGKEISATPIAPTDAFLEYVPWKQKSEEYSFVTLVEQDLMFRIINLKNYEQVVYDLSEYKDFGNLFEVTEFQNSCGYLGLFGGNGENIILQFSPGSDRSVEIFRLRQTTSNAPRWHPKLSPTGEYISYVVFSGYLGYDWAEFQNIEIVHLNDPDRPIQLSTRGGAWKQGGEWAPEGSRIAFTDYDQKGFLQVFIASLPTFEIQQVTSLQNSLLMPGELRWSPDGSKLAVVFQNQQPLMENMDTDVEIWVIDSRKAQPIRVLLPSTIVAIGERPVWSEDGRTLLLFLSMRDETNQRATSLYWVDSENGQLIHSLSEQEIVNLLGYDWYGLSHYFPLTTDLSEIALFNGNNEEIIEYDARTRQIDPIPLVQFLEPVRIFEVRTFKEEVLFCND